MDSTDSTTNITYQTVMCSAGKEVKCLGKLIWEQISKRETGKRIFNCSEFKSSSPIMLKSGNTFLKQSHIKKKYKRTVQSWVL